MANSFELAPGELRLRLVPGQRGDHFIMRLIYSMLPFLQHQLEAGVRPFF